MIEKIHINNVATYNSSQTIDKLKCINFIFGANGSGKTTISRVIDKVNNYNDCKLTWQNNIPLETFVYNRDFIERNFNQKGSLKGIFTLGNESVEIEKQIENLKPNREKLNKDIISLENQLTENQQELTNLEERFVKKCWRIKKRHEDDFSTVFSGLNRNKELFFKRLLEEKTQNTAELLTLDVLKKKANTIFADSPSQISLLSKLSADTLISIETNPILQQIIIGNQSVDIATLIKRLNNSDWVKQGLHYHQQVPTICPFCQQYTDEYFAKSLKDFFSEAYEEDIKALKQLLDQYKTGEKQLSDTIQNNLVLNNPFLKKDLFESESQTLFERIKRNLFLLEEKITEPSKKITLEPLNTLITNLQKLITEANASTDHHNKTVMNIRTEKQKLISQIWKFVLNELTDDFSDYEKDKEKLSAPIAGKKISLAKKQQALVELKNTIQELERKATSTKPVVEDINKLLKKFGFNSFKIDIEDQQHYKICRQNGEDASLSLSEGEKTFITFLYFYSLIKGSQTNSGMTTDRIVVFDDPISSLDSDILYIVSSLIKNIIEEARNKIGYIKQLFVLTHNVYFHKEITFNRDRKNNNRLKDESFWIVKKPQKDSIIKSNNKNPVTSAYELLWDNITSADISNINLQNNLRRILENYFTIWGGIKKEDICSHFEGQEKVICNSLFSWVNDGSHSIYDDLYISHDEKTNERYLEIFKNIFYKLGHIRHYEMMCSKQ